MKTKYYRYNASNEAKEFIDSKFGNNEIEGEITESTITLQTLEGPVTIDYTVIDKPLVFAGHQFEELRDYRVEYTIDDKVFTTKSLQHKLSQAQIIEKAVTTWVMAQTKVSKQPINRSKAKEERELLKALKAKPVDEIIVREPKKQQKKAKKTVVENNEF